MTRSKESYLKSNRGQNKSLFKSTLRKVSLNRQNAIERRSVRYFITYGLCKQERQTMKEEVVMYKGREVHFKTLHDWHLEVVAAEFPPGFHACIAEWEPGRYRVFLNSMLPAEEMEKAFVHELVHLYRGDLHKDVSVEEIEEDCHKATDRIIERKEGLTMMRELTMEEEVYIEGRLEDYHDYLLGQAEIKKEERIEYWESNLEEGDEITEQDMAALKMELEDWIDEEMVERKKKLVEEVLKEYE